jgi:hypothetical protein
MEEVEAILIGGLSCWDAAEYLWERYGIAAGVRPSTAPSSVLLSQPDDRMKGESASRMILATPVK